MKERAPFWLTMTALLLRVGCTVAVFFTVAQDWNWDMVRYGLPAITPVHAFGVACMVNTLTMVEGVSKAPKIENTIEAANKSMSISFASALIGCPVSLLICWVCR